MDKNGQNQQNWAKMDRINKIGQNWTKRTKLDKLLKENKNKSIEARDDTCA